MNASLCSTDADAELTMAAAISSMSVGSLRLPISSEKNDFSGTALNLLV